MPELLQISEDVVGCLLLFMDIISLYKLLISCKVLLNHSSIGKRLKMATDEEVVYLCMYGGLKDVAWDEIIQRFPQLLIPMDNKTIRKAVNLYCSDSKKAISIYGPIELWNISEVTRMSYMFWNATSFNKPLNNWDVSSVTGMSYMFYNALSFNQPLNYWNVSNVTDMSYMFYDATSFNQPDENIPRKLN